MSELDEEKRFYSRFWALHDDPTLVEIFRLFGAEPFRRSCVLEGFNAFLGQNSIRGRRCVEIGTWKELTAIVLARYFDEVVTIDLAPDGDRRVIAAAVATHNIRFVTVSDNAGKAAFLASLKFDFAFLDGDHEHDTETDFALVQRCGRVLFHEYWKAQPAVWDLVEKWRQRGVVTAGGKFALWQATNG